MASSYNLRHRLAEDILLRKEPTLGAYWVGQQKPSTVSLANRTSQSLYLRLPRYATSLDLEPLAYPSYQDYKYKMLIQYPVLRRTWRANLGKIILDTFHRSRLGLRDYWINPQRSYHIGSVSRSSRKHLLVLPGNTGISDVDSTIKPAFCQFKHKLIWKYRWQKLRGDYQSKKLSLRSTVTTPRRFWPTPNVPHFVLRRNGKPSCHLTSDSVPRRPPASHTVMCCSCLTSLGHILELWLGAPVIGNQQGAES